MSKPSQSPKKKNRAQAMVEFALALPILLLVIYGLLETGRLIFMYASVVTAARSAARYGSASGETTAGTHYYDDCGGIQAAANRFAFIQRFSQIQIDYDSGPGTPSIGTAGSGCPIDTAAHAGHPANGDRIKVSVRTDFRPIVPLVPFTAFPIISTDSRTLLVGVPIEVTPIPQPFDPGSSLQLQKTADASTYDHVGQVIHYTFKIINIGTSDIAGPFTITDPNLGAPFQCGGAPGSLAGGASYTCNNPQPYTITVADCNAASLTNTATVVNGDGTAMGQNSATIQGSCVAAITLSKTGTAPNIIEAGQLIQYTFVITNTGSTDLTPPYAIQDSLIGSNWSCPSTPNPLPIGGTVTCTGSYAIKNSDINTGSVSNTATATAKNGTTTVTSPPASAVVPTPPLQLVVTASPNPVTAVGQTVTFTYTLSNHLGGNLNAITITDTRGATNLACLPSLGKNGSGSCTHQYVVTRADFDSPTGSFTNTATANTTDANGNAVKSNTYTVLVNIQQNLSLQMTKSASPTLTGPGSFFPTGQVITYTYRVYNSSNVTLTPTTATPLTVTDGDPRVAMMPTCNVTSGSIAPLTYLTPDCTGTLTLTDADIAAGSVTSMGTANAKFGIRALQGTATYTLITFYDARLSLVKTANKSYFTNMGQPITYSYAIKNTGGQVLAITSPYTLTDNKIVGNITCPLAIAGTQLQYGASIACSTATYTTTGADVTAGKVTNTVQRATGSTNPPTAPGPASLTVTLLQCDATHPTTAPPGLPIADGSNTSWDILNNTGTTLHLAGASMTWSGANLTDIFLAGQSVWTGSASSNGILTVPVTGWPAIPFSLTTPTTMAFKFSGTATGIKVSLVFQEAVGGNSCNLNSP